MISTFHKPITELIKMRYSVRSFDNQELSTDIKEKLQAYIQEINEAEGIFGGKIRVRLIQKDDGDKEVKLGTYGVIRGAKTYFAVACEKKDYNLEDLGFLFEKVILFCTSLGLGTVWMGGTFNKGHFVKAMELKGNETLQIISPVGVEGSKKSLLAKVFSNNTAKRKAFNEIFFNENFQTPLQYEDAGEYGEVLEMVRLAPSAVNKQPWRILKEGNNYHFYSDGKVEMNRIDIGIGMCHFYLTAAEKGLKGEFKVLDRGTGDKFAYVVSWVCL